MEKTGYPSIDKPWEQYYNQEEYKKEKAKRTVYQEIFHNNKDYVNDLALEYFGAKINYKEMFQKIDATQKAFEEYGIKKGQFVTICAAGTPETVYSFYALSKIGAVANMMAPYFEHKGLVDRIADCESDVLIVMDQFYPEIKEAIKQSRIKNVIVLPTLNSSFLRFVTKKYQLEKHSNELYWNQFIKDGKNQKNVDAIPYEKDMPLVMVYSSGTTGANKGILLSNDSFQNSVQSYPASGVDTSRRQKFYQIIPPWYSTGLNTSIHLPLFCGMSVFMDPRFERDVFVKNIIKAKPNYAVAPTSMYEGFLDEKLVGNHDLSFFNYPFEGGEPLREEVANNIEDVLKKHGSDVPLRTAYGQCECGAAITTQTQKAKCIYGSVGIPLPGVSIGIFDDNFNEQKYNQRGQILANTPCGMLEYYKNPVETKKYFYIDNNGIKWNCTGDIGYIDENGNLYVEGRASDYSMINHKKIFNFDIEKRIMALPEIKMCDILCKEDDSNNNTLVAHLVFNDNIKFDNDTLVDECHKIQTIIFNVNHDIDEVPNIFKIRDSFPYAKSGKRDVKQLLAETDNFKYIDKSYLVSDFERTLKK